MQGVGGGGGGSGRGNRAKENFSDTSAVSESLLPFSAVFMFIGIWLNFLGKSLASTFDPPPFAHLKLATPLIVYILQCIMNE